MLKGRYDGEDGRASRLDDKAKAVSGHRHRPDDVGVRKPPRRRMPPPSPVNARRPSSPAATSLFRI
jgi:hypothetical protein